jgi:hypothetical protein
MGRSPPITVSKVPHSSFLTLQTAPFLALLGHQALSDRSKTLLVSLLFLASPRTGCIEPVTQAGIAQAIGWSRSKTRRALDELAAAGIVDFDLPVGAGVNGSVTVLAYYDVLQPTRWLARQRAIGRTPGPADS